MSRRGRAALALASWVAATAPLVAGRTRLAAGAQEAAATLAAERGRGVAVSWHAVTGVARFVRLDGTARGAVLSGADGDVAVEVLAFLERHGALFGLRAPGEELALLAADVDRFGLRTLSFRQRHRGVPVFGAILRAQLDRDGRLARLGGTVVPDLSLGVVPRVTSSRAAESARQAVAAAASLPRSAVAVRTPRLEIYRLGLDRGVDGEARLVWTVDVGLGSAHAARLFVDAISGKPIDRHPLAFDVLERRSFTGLDQQPFDGLPDSWPEAPDWVEGDAIPSGDAERDAALVATADAWALFAALGLEGFDGDAPLDVSWNRAAFCPNASWNGIMTAFCAGLANHDVVVHEWAHAYTQATHGLIYRWQSGALNEAYSDIWGELADQASTLAAGADTDSPGGRRADESCSGFRPARLRIVSPQSLATQLAAAAVGQAAFGPPAGGSPPARIAASVDGVGAADDGCEAAINGGELAGAIAFVRRGGCDFEDKARNAQAAGAIGLVVGNLSSSPAPGTPPALDCDAITGCDRAIAIPALSLALAGADALANALASGEVRGALESGQNQGSGDSVRWLLGEDARPPGVARDIWKPSCFGDPDRVGDASYHCAASDNGGVHTNSGVASRALALLVDGGRANGVDVEAIGRAAAAHLYFRAQSAYQVPYSDFSDHADALEAACDDLVGSALDDPWGGGSRTLAAADCAAVAAAIAAVELRAQPPCAFQPLLAKSPPSLCPAFEVELERATFDSSDEGWSVSRRDVAAPETFEPRDWTRTPLLPEARNGSAFFAPDPHAGSCVTGVGGDDESGVLVLESPQLGAPNGFPMRLAFDHYLATEAGWDGGNLKLSVAGGPWQLVPAAAFLYNPYRGELLAASAGNSDPMAGEPAFHGLDEGSNAGSWGRSIIDLAGLVPPGARFRLRFELGSDECVGTELGWYVDDVRLAACVAAPPIFLDGFESGGANRWN